MSYWGFTLVPLVLLRKLASAVTRPERVIASGFHPPGRAADWFLRRLMRVETGARWTPFIGSSLMAVGKHEAATR